MKVLTKTKSLVFIIILLLITNVALMIFFMVKHKPGEKGYRDREQSGMYNSLQKEVGFSEDQLKQYQTLRKEQFQKLKPLFNEVRKSKENFYSLLYVENPTESLINAVADSIGQNQKILDLQMFTYFQKIRNTCTPGQLPKFDSTIKKVVLRMMGGPGRSKRDHSK